MDNLEENEEHNAEDNDVADLDDEEEEYFALADNIRRGQIMLFGVVLVGFIAMSLVITKPTDLENEEATKSVDNEPEIITANINEIYNSSRMSLYTQAEEYSLDGSVLYNVGRRQQNKLASKSMINEQHRIKYKNGPNNRANDPNTFIKTVKAENAKKLIKEKQGYNSQDEENSIFDQTFRKKEKVVRREIHNPLNIARRLMETVEIRDDDEIQERKWRKSRQDQSNDKYLQHRIYEDLELGIVVM